MSDAAAFDDDFEEELQEFDAEEGDDERGLSGLIVLAMGVLMLTALASIVFVAYKYGVKTGKTQNETPYVAADPEPLKIENSVADNASDAASGREVYDSLGGAAGDETQVIATTPEEPVARDATDPIAAIASGEGASNDGDSAVADRIAELARADEAMNSDATPKANVPAADINTPQTPSVKPEPKPATTATPASAPASMPKPASANPASGSYLVQVGAFRSQVEADGQWSKLQSKLGDYVSGKGPDVEVADLGAKGVYYRLRIGPFTTADDAKTYCVGLKDRGTDCLVKKK
ncbi:MAG: SPOR domain-containing protein [Parvularculaceae bacterium]